MDFRVHHKTNRLFLQIVLAAIFLITALIITFDSSLHIALTSLGDFISNKAQAACGCGAAPHSFLYLISNGLTITLALALTSLVFTALLKTFLAFLHTKKFIHAQKKYLTPLSSKLLLAATNTNTANTLVEINTKQPFIFCYGLVFPKIYISSAIVTALSNHELQAALLHEKHHILFKEPARLLFIKFLNGFNIIPGIKTLTAKYLSFAEIAADELATHNFTEKSYLASAMIKILEMEEHALIQKELSLSFFSQITEERILVLSNSKYTPVFKYELLKTFMGIIGAGMIAYLLLQGTHTQQAHAATTNNTAMCTGKIDIKQCQNEQTKCMIGKIFLEEKIDCKKSIKEEFSSK